MTIMFLFSCFKKHLLGGIISNSFVIRREECFQNLPQIFITAAL